MLLLVPPLSCRFQAPGLHCQAGLVNLTKLRQLDLRWNSENCSGDLRLNGHSVSKVSEVYGDYSTVLANQGKCLAAGLGGRLRV